jgi:hypothetical protein
MGSFVRRITKPFKKITKPVAKILDKIVPNEIKPALPYIAAAVPFLAPTAGILGTMAGRAALSGGANILSQLSQEGSEGDFSGLSALLATATGALSAPGTATYGPAGPPGSEQIIQSGSPGAADFFAQKAAGMDTGILKSGTQFLGKTAEGLGSMGDILRPGGEAAGLNLATAKAALVPFTQGSADLAMSTARRALQDYEKELEEFNLQAGQAQEASDSARRDAIISSMTAAAFDQGTIDDTLAELGLKDGGRVGLQQGGTASSLATIEDYRKALENVGAGDQSQKMQSLGEYSRSMAARDLSQAAKRGGIESFLRGQLGSGIIPGMSAMQSPMSGTSKFGRDLVLDALTKSYMKPYSMPTGSAYDQMRFAQPGQSGSFVEMQGGQFGDGMGIVIDGKRYTTEQEAINDVGLERYNMFYADGGRVGLRDGGDPDFGGIPAAVKAVEKKPKEFLVDKLKVTVQPGQSEQMAIMNAMMNDVDGVMPEDRKMEFYKLYLPQLKASGEISEKQYEGLMGELFGEGKANGGLMGLKMGGMPMEMDYRQGGFIPVGSKERADDVPARLSKNEFVMTADAVRAAGGGSVNKGAQRMYELMNNLEARV